MRRVPRAAARSVAMAEEVQLGCRVLEGPAVLDRATGEGDTGGSVADPASTPRGGIAECGEGAGEHDG